VDSLSFLRGSDELTFSQQTNIVTNLNGTLLKIVENCRHALLILKIVENYRHALLIYESVLSSEIKSETSRFAPFVFFGQIIDTKSRLIRDLSQGGTDSYGPSLDLRASEGLWA